MIKKNNMEKKATVSGLKSFLNERKNDKGENVPKKCTICGGDIVLEIHGEPVYICEKCGKYYGTPPCPYGKNKK